MLSFMRLIVTQDARDEPPSEGLSLHKTPVEPPRLSLAADATSRPVHDGPCARAAPVATTMYNGVIGRQGCEAPDPAWTRHAAKRHCHQD